MQLIIAVGVLIVVLYVFSLWWLLRRESRQTKLGLLALCGFALALHLFYSDRYPPGINEDEGKSVEEGYKYLTRGDLLGVGPEGPILLNLLYQGSLPKLLGPTEWSVRIYPTVAGILAVPAAFALARGIGLRVAASFAFATFCSALPWALFYSRITWGGELMFHQLLVLAAVARLIFSAGAWGDVIVGGLGLSLLLYSYPGGWSMVGMPLVGLVLARGHRRLLALCILLLAAAAITPYYMKTLSSWITEVTTKVPPGYQGDFWTTLIFKTRITFEALVMPRARNGWMAVQTAAMHPLWFLPIAVIGSFTGVRRSLFFWSGFVGTLLPSVMSEGDAPSTHRMLVMFPFISLAAAAAIDLFPRRLATVAAVVVSAAITIQSALFYFSDNFWMTETRWIFDPEISGMVESLPAPGTAKIVLSPDIGGHYGYRSMLDDWSLLDTANWYPPKDTRVTYAFGALSVLLQPWYQQLLGPERMKQFGRAFTVSVDSADWRWMRQHGWEHELRCKGIAHAAQVPVLFRLGGQFPRAFCPTSSQSIWRGEWAGPPSQVRLHFSGHVFVRTPRGEIEAKGREARLDFSVSPGDALRVSLLSTHVSPTGLMVLTPGGERLPPWDWINPGLAGNTDEDGEIEDAGLDY